MAPARDGEDALCAEDVGAPVAQQVSDPSLEQLGVDLAASKAVVEERNERWAETWAVHQKVVQAERKYG